MKRIVLFDGECNFCDSSVQFIIKRDPVAHFLFTSLQSEKGIELAKQYAIPKEVDSLVLIENGKAYLKVLRRPPHRKKVGRLMASVILIHTRPT